MSAVSHSTPSQASHSLPPFAQAFNSSPDALSSQSNTLPPIMSRGCITSPRRVASPPESVRASQSSADNPADVLAGRKRLRPEAGSEVDPEGPADSASHLVRIKEEERNDQSDDESPPSRPAPLPDREYTSGGTPAPSSSKKRRTTISGGAPQPLNTQLLGQPPPPPEHSGSTPISPVVRGFAMRDDATSMEQVRSMLNVKKNQKALIEQRRGSVPMLSGVVPIDDRSHNPPTSANKIVPNRPNSNGSSSANPNSARRPPQRAPSPPPSAPAVHPPTSSLPPPPISFTHRRTGQVGTLRRKPADILISPRETHTPDQLQPEIQSAPPIPHAGQQGFLSSRFSMTLPRLPSALGPGGDSMRRVTSTHVPPTPTRLSRNTHAGQSHLSQSSTTGRSPPSVAIASSLVPPTPSFLHQSAANQGDKAAFLAPFEIFYDALNDSRQLKIWLSEQIQKSNTLMQSLARQQEKLEETVENIVERRTGSMRHEIAGLHRRIEELEEVLRLTNSPSRRPSVDSSSHAPSSMKIKGKSATRNGLGGSSLSVPETSYTFPPQPPQPPESHARRRTDSGHRGTSSPGWIAEREGGYELQEPHGASSPAPYDSRRVSVSAMRMDPPRSESWEREPTTSSVSSLQQKSPRPPPYRELSGPGQRSPRGSDSRPALLRKISSSRLHGSGGEGRQQHDRERGTPPHRHTSVRSPEHAAAMDISQ